MAAYVVSTSLVASQDRWAGIQISFLSLAQYIGYWLFLGLTDIRAHHKKAPFEWDMYMPNSPTKTLMKDPPRYFIINAVANSIHILVRLFAWRRVRGLVIGSRSSSFSAAVTCKRSSLVRVSPPDAHTRYALFEMDAHGCRLRAGRVSLLYMLVFPTAWRGENTMEEWSCCQECNPHLSLDASEPSVSWFVAFPV